jgi:hypothetical protein
MAGSFTSSYHRRPGGEKGKRGKGERAKRGRIGKEFDKLPEIILMWVQERTENLNLR